MAERHVREGGTRVGRQEAHVADLDRERHDHMLPQANQLLETMRAQQKLAQEHLARLLGESADEGKG